jgi:hypothetical protein
VSSTVPMECSISYSERDTPTPPQQVNSSSFACCSACLLLSNGPWSPDAL